MTASLYCVEVFWENWSILQFSSLLDITQSLVIIWTVLFSRYISNKEFILAFTSGIVDCIYACFTTTTTATFYTSLSFVWLQLKWALWKCLYNSKIPYAPKICTRLYSDWFCYGSVISSVWRHAIHFPIFPRVVSGALEHKYECLSGSGVTLKNMVEIDHYQATTKSKSKMWDEINHPFPKFSGATVEVWN